MSLFKDKLPPQVRKNKTKKLKKIAYICDTYHPISGGTAEVARVIAESFAARGYKVDVYTPWIKGRNDKSKRVEKIKNVNIYRIRSLAKVGNYVYIWPQLLPLLIRKDYDIIHAHVAGHPHTYLASLAAKLTRTDFYISTHSPWGKKGKRSRFSNLFRKISYNIFMPFVFKTAKKILILTAYERKYLKKYNVAQEKIIEIPNGIASFFLENHKDNMNDNYGYNKEDRVVLFVGRLDRVKNPIEFVMTGKYLLKTYPNKKYKFLIVGPDQGEKEHILKYIKYDTKFRLLDKVRYDHLPKIYRTAKLLLVPSIREAFGMVIIEAYSQGLPVVAVRNGGIPYILQDKKNGSLYKQGNIKEAGEKIHEIFENKILKNEIGMRNRKTARMYEWKNIINNIESLYLETN